MAVANVFNRIYYKQDLEELQQACKRLNTLIQLQGIRTGHVQAFDQHQARPRMSVTREHSLEVEPKVAKRLDKIRREILSQNPNMQSIIHRELLALDHFKDRLAEKRARKSADSSNITADTEESLAAKKVRLAENRAHKYADSSYTTADTRDSVLTDTVYEDQSRKSITSKKEVNFLEDVLEPASQIKSITSIHAENIQALSDATDRLQNLTVDNVDMHHLIQKEIDSIDKFQQNIITRQSSDNVIYSNPDYGRRLTKCSGMTFDEALQAVRQDCKDQDMLLLISSLSGESIGETPFLQVTVVHRNEKRLLGSFQIPDERLRSLDEEGFFHKYPVIFVSKAITNIKSSMDVILGHLTKLSPIETDQDEIDQFFDQAETNRNQIFARPDYRTERRLYICDFFSTDDKYVGSLKIDGVDILKQLKNRPAIIENFEIIVDPNYRFLPAKIKSIVEMLVDKLGLVSLYDRFGEFLYSVCRRWVY